MSTKRGQTGSDGGAAAKGRTASSGKTKRGAARKPAIAGAPSRFGQSHSSARCRTVFDVWDGSTTLAAISRSWPAADAAGEPDPRRLWLAIRQMRAATLEILRVIENGLYGFERVPAEFLGPPTAGERAAAASTRSVAIFEARDALSRFWRGWLAARHALARLHPEDRAALERLRSDDGEPWDVAKFADLLATAGRPFFATTQSASAPDRIVADAAEFWINVEPLQMLARGFDRSGCAKTLLVLWSLEDAVCRTAWGGFDAEFEPSAEATALAHAIMRLEALAEPLTLAHERFCEQIRAALAEPSIEQALATRPGVRALVGMAREYVAEFLRALSPLSEPTLRGIGLVAIAEAHRPLAGESCWGMDVLAASIQNMGQHWSDGRRRSGSWIETLREHATDARWLLSRIASPRFWLPRDSFRPCWEALLRVRVPQRAGQAVASGPVESTPPPGSPALDSSGPRGRSRRPSVREKLALKKDDALILLGDLLDNADAGVERYALERLLSRNAGGEREKERSAKRVQRVISRLTAIGLVHRSGHGLYEPTEKAEDIAPFVHRQIKKLEEARHARRRSPVE